MLLIYLLCKFIYVFDRSEIVLNIVWLIIGFIMFSCNCLVFVVNVIVLLLLIILKYIWFIIFGIIGFIFVGIMEEFVCNFGKLILFKLVCGFDESRRKLLYILESFMVECFNVLCIII